MWAYIDLLFATRAVDKQNSTTVKSWQQNKVQNKVQVKQSACANSEQPTIIRKCRATIT